jgi:predicted RNase H-like HicB family nuclease
MERQFEATIEKHDKWYIGWVDAVPGAFSQGKTVKEVEENLKESVQLVLESQRELKTQNTLKLYYSPNMHYHTLLL